MYEGPYVVKKAFSGGALILANMPINSDVVIWYFAWKSLSVHLIFTSKKKKKKKKKQKNKKKNKKKKQQQKNKNQKKKKFVKR